MSEERIIRINKVLRELNISLERAVDYLKDKGIGIESNPNTKISQQEFNILQSQFAGDKGNKEASKEVGEEKRKEKEALRIEREKEIEEKRKLDEERAKQQEVIKAKAVLSAPVQVGKIDLNPKKTVSAPVPIVPEKVITPKDATSNETPSKNTVEKTVEKKEVITEKKTDDVSSSLGNEVKDAVKTKEVKSIENPKAVVEKKNEDATSETPAEESITTQYQKLSGATLTGQVIDLSQFNKPKKKKEDRSCSNH